eukprot:TRINITY_DN3278_c0_g1_i1.p1 TRINITY_DN3278_c0_g1~~TRINITY_DN3278_c0_g1_i1.p1  ORF type:complete len:350 (+),score=67.59 TRINITY_DN3278_c0_g1_i1:124-1173(+)
MNTTVYPTNYAFSDDYFSYPSSQLFSSDVEESWDFLSNDTQPSLDVFDGYMTDPSCSDTVPSSDEEEITVTPTPSSPVPFPLESPLTPPPSGELEFQMVTNNNWLIQYQQLQQQQQYQQYQLQQYQLMCQQNLLMCLQNTPFAPSMPSFVPSFVPSVSPSFAPAPSMPPSFVSPVSGTASGWPVPGCSVPNYDTKASESKANLTACGSDTFVHLTSLDASHFGSSAVSLPKLKAIPVDISGNLSDIQYNKIFKKYHLQLQLDSHPTMTESDLEDIRVHGRMYFLKNVKTIVPKIGPWKFNAHISHRRTDERQYNIPGLAITCKVKEWLADDGLWRLYHFKKGKTVKSKQ